MFQLYDRTRRQIGMALFVLLAVVPTLLVLAWAVWLRLPGLVQAEAERLGQPLGVKVVLKNVRHLTPTKTVYEGVQLADAENGRTIFSCKRLEAVWRKATDAKGQPQPSLVLTASEAELHATESESAWAALDRFLARRTGWGDVDAVLVAAQLTLQTADGPQVLQNAQVQLQSAPTISQVALRFHLSETEGSRPVQFCVGRSRQTEPPFTGFSLYTDGNEIPCSLLPAWFDVPGLLGSQCRLRGYVSAYRTAQGWTGEAQQCQLRYVDLNRLVTGRFPHTLSGSGQISIQTAKFSEGRLSQMAGELRGINGQISSSLLDAASRRLSLQSYNLVDVASQSTVPYRELAVSFAIDDRGLQIQGLGRDGVVLSGQQGRLLGPSAAQGPIAVASLLQALVPNGHVQLPTSPQAEWLLQRLPSGSVLPVAQQPRDTSMR